MLEILLIALLCKTNKKNAAARGRKPGGFVALTVLLWIVPEFVGGFIAGLSDMETGSIYVLALAFATAGGFISYLIAKNCKPGNDVPEKEVILNDVLSRAESLDVPATIEIVRDKTFVSALVRYTVSLNGKPAAALRNGESVTVTTFRRQNILHVVDAYGTEMKPFIFDVASGSHASIHFTPMKLPANGTTGTLPATTLASEDALRVSGLQ